MQPHQPTVLVVDDDVGIRDLLRDSLEHVGHRVAEASDGSAALAQIGAGGVDLVLLDLLMPVIDGLEVCRQARATGRGLYLPIIIMTALGSEKDLRTGFAAGADDYVTKPFSVAELLDRVGVWLRMRERLRLAEQQRFAETEAALQLARAPLQVLVNLTRVWEAQAPGAEVAEVRPELEQAVGTIIAELEQLSHLLRAE